MIDVPSLDRVQRSSGRVLAGPAGAVRNTATGDVFHFDGRSVVDAEPFGFVEPGVLADCPSGEVVPAGADSGVTGPKANCGMSGAVDEFEGWAGCRVHMDGEIV